MIHALPIACATALVLVAGCEKKSAKQRAKEASAAASFWPEAPAPTRTTGTRTLRYQPDHVGRYVMTAKGGTPPGSVPLTYTLTLALDMRAGAAPGERDVYLELIDVALKAAGREMLVKVDREEMSIVEDGTPVRVRRGEPGPLSVADMTDKPFTTLVFSDGRVVALRPAAGHPFNQFGGTEDLLDNALVLFPDLPAGEIPVGHRWSMTRTTPVGTTQVEVDVTYDFEYAGDGACPSGAPSCSLLTFTASSPGVDVENEGVKARAAYGFAGKVFFDTERGVIDESRVRMDLEVKTVGVDMRIDGTFVVKPQRAAP